MELRQEFKKNILSKNRDFLFKENIGKCLLWSNKCKLEFFSLYIYIHIYICVCVCVCVNKKNTQ